MAANSRETTKGYVPTEESIPEKKKKNYIWTRQSLQVYISLLKRNSKRNLENKDWNSELWMHILLLLQVVIKT